MVDHIVGKRKGRYSEQQSKDVVRPPTLRNEVKPDLAVQRALLISPSKVLFHPASIVDRTVLSRPVVKADIRYHAGKPEQRQGAS